MLVDSLLKLSSKLVAELLIYGYYQHVNITLDAPLSDKVFLEAVGLFMYFPFSALSQENGLKLNLSSFDNGMKEISRQNKESLRFHNIRSLVLNCEQFRMVPEYKIETEEGEEVLDVVRILKTCLNEESCQNLKDLHLNYSPYFPDNWIELIGPLFPNLKTFQNKAFIEDEFRMICESFPNLVHLKIFEATILNWDGFRLLTNLQTLSLCHSSFPFPDGMENLFELQNLRVIDASGTRGFFKNLLLCEGSFQNVKFIEFQNSDITEAELRILVDRNQSLEAIALLETSCERLNFSDPRIKIINLSTCESTMHTVEYILDKKVHVDMLEQVEQCLARLKELLEYEKIPDDFKEDVFLTFMLKTMRPPMNAVHDIDNGLDCLILFLEHLFPGKTMNDVLRHLDAQPKTPLVIKQRWAAQIVSEYYSNL